MFCPQCGKEYSRRVNFCCHCGTALSYTRVHYTQEAYALAHGQENRGCLRRFADYLELDVTLVRIIWLMLAVFGGWGIIGYFIAWIVMPEEPLPQASAATVCSAIPQPAGNR